MRLPSSVSGVQLGIQKETSDFPLISECVFQGGYKVMHRKYVLNTGTMVKMTRRQTLFGDLLYKYTRLELASHPYGQSGFNINIMGVNEHVRSSRSCGVKWWKKPGYL